MLLNKDGVVSSLKDAQLTSDTVFARPVLDSKSFNGRWIGGDNEFWGWDLREYEAVACP